jgi:hypothetical protein
VLEDASSARPLLRADRPGNYRLRLATTMAAAKPGGEKAVVNKSFSSGELGAFAEYMKEEMNKLSAGEISGYLARPL